MAISESSLYILGAVAGAEATGVIDVTSFGSASGKEDGGGDSTGSIGGIPNIKLPAISSSFQAPSFQAPEMPKLSFDPSFNPNTPALSATSPLMDFNSQNDNGNMDMPFIGNDKNKKKLKSNIPGYTAQDLQQDLNNNDSSIGPIGSGQGRNSSNISGNGVAGETGRDIGRAGSNFVIGIGEGMWNASVQAGKNAFSGTDKKGFFAGPVDATYWWDEYGQVGNTAKKTIGNVGKTIGNVLRGNKKNKKKEKSSNNNASIFIGENSSGGNLNPSSSSSKPKTKNKKKNSGNTQQQAQPQQKTHAQKVLTGSQSSGGTKNKKKQKQQISGPFSGLYGA